ncbi:MAG: radical SAM protein [Egibacteraceae bacterium]
MPFLWLEITGKCQLACEHCYAGSGPTGTQGTMTTSDWIRVIDEAREFGVQRLQFIGGEPTLHSDLPVLIRHALDHGITVEVFTNLVHVGEKLWKVFALPGVRLATSCYSPDAAEHDAITARRGSHGKTLVNIRKTIRLGIPLRVGVVGVRQGQGVDDAVAELTRLGVADVGVDELRQVGRGVRDQEPGVNQLCGNCANGTLAVSPDGLVWPCVFARWMVLGNVRDTSLADIHTGPAASIARAELNAAFAQRSRAEVVDVGDCGPHCRPNCHPSCEPSCSPRCGPTCVPISCQPRECWPSFEGRGRLKGHPSRDSEETVVGL